MSGWGTVRAVARTLSMNLTRMQTLGTLLLLLALVAAAWWKYLAWLSS